jgi:hypothetical protein
MSIVSANTMRPEAMPGSFSKDMNRDSRAGTTACHLWAIPMLPEPSWTNIMYTGDRVAFALAVAHPASGGMFVPLLLPPSPKLPLLEPPLPPLLLLKLPLLPPLLPLPPLPLSANPLPWVPPQQRMVPSTSGDAANHVLRPESLRFGMVLRRQYPEHRRPGRQLWLFRMARASRPHRA